MLKKLFYWTIFYFCRIGASAYFNKIEINGRKDLPTDGPIIFAPNHQNAFLDAILIGIFSWKPVSYFTRGDIFVPPFTWFLDALNMLPVFRVKDGFSKVTTNGDTFSLSVDNLLKGKNLMVFPEANHDYPYVIRTLSKGTARVAFDAQLKTDRPVYIVMVGLNFFRRHTPRFKLIMNYARPINLKDYLSLFEEHNGKAYTAVRNEMTTRLKENMVIPNKDDQYEERAKVFTRRNESLTFKQLREKAENIDGFTSEKYYPFLKPFIWLLSIPNFVVLGVSYYVNSLFKDPVFSGSMKFGVTALVAPIWYLIILAVLSFFLDFKTSLLIVGVLILLLFIRQYLVRYITITEHKWQSNWE